MNRLDHVVTESLNNYKDQSNESINSQTTFDTINSNLSSGTSDPLSLVTVFIQRGKKHRATNISGLTCLWDSGDTNSMIKILHTKIYECNMRSNKVEYSTVTGVYFTTHDVKVPFCMPEFSSSKIINHCFHVDSNKAESVIGYDMIIGRDLMVQLGLTDNFKRQFLQWDGATVHMKDARNFLGQSDLIKRKMREVAMQNAEPASTREATGLLVKILDSNYEKADLKNVADNASQLNSEERTLLLSLLEDFKDLFGGTFGDWDTDPVELELNPYSKQFNSIYYWVPRINKEKL